MYRALEMYLYLMWKLSHVEFGLKMGFEEVESNLIKECCVCLQPLMAMGDAELMLGVSMEGRSVLQRAYEVAPFLQQREVQE